jgi:hypothetical protein
MLRPGDKVDGLDWGAAELDGGPLDATVAARVADLHLMREIEARRGRGLAWRLAARLVDAARLIDLLENDGPFDQGGALARDVGAAPAADGLIVTRASVESGRVTAFSQLTPTDFSLHPRGVLARMLASVPQKKSVQAMAFTSLALEAVDARAPTRLVCASGPEIRRARVG